MSRQYCIRCDKMPRWFSRGKSVFIELYADSIVSATRQGNMFCDENKGAWYIYRIYINYKKR